MSDKALDPDSGPPPERPPDQPERPAAEPGTRPAGPSPELPSGPGESGKAREPGAAEAAEGPVRPAAPAVGERPAEPGEGQPPAPSADAGLDAAPSPDIGSDTSSATVGGQAPADVSESAPRTGPAPSDATAREPGESGPPAQLAETPSDASMSAQPTETPGDASSPARSRDTATEAGTDAPPPRNEETDKREGRMPDHQQTDEKAGSGRSFRRDAESPTQEGDEANKTSEFSRQEELADRFESYIKPFVFEGHHPSETPRLVLLGGQPAAGKSQAVAGLREHYAGEDLVAVTGDEFRKFHPDYRRLLEDDPLGLPNAISPDTAGWVRGCIDYALENQYSLLLENTFGNADVVADTARRFAAAGYQTEVAVVAVRPETSRLDSLARYLEPRGSDPPRWTPLGAHDKAVENLPSAVARLEQVPEVDRITMWNRSGEALFTNERGPDRQWQHHGSASERLLAEHARPLEPEQARNWLALYSSKQVQALREHADPRARLVYEALRADASRVADMAAPADPR